MNNDKPTIGMISIYPSEGERHPELGGVASYTKNIVEEIANEAEVTVYANKFDAAKEYKMGKISIRRCWADFFPLDLLNSIRKNEWEEDIYHIQHEYFLYGEIISAVMVPLLLLVIGIKQKPRVVTIHGILPLDTMDKDFMDAMGIEFPSTHLAKVGIKYLTKLIGFFSTLIIVHEKEFKERLVNQYGFRSEKVKIVHHPVNETTTEMTKEDARNKLGMDVDKRILLFFGYLTGYKGLKELITTKNYLDDNYKLIIAGGRHPRRKGNEEYERYIQELKNLADEVEYSEIEFTGFVSEDDIHKYFSAADICVLPYKYRIASSGPRNLAVSYGTPIIFGCPNGGSEVLAENIKSRLANEESISNISEIKKNRNPKVVARKTIKLYNSIHI